MKRIKMLATFAVLATAVTLSYGSPRCSGTLVAGDWGFTINGVIILPAPVGAVPVAAVGRFRQDASGNMQGTEARSLGGAFDNETLKGTVAVHADCTAKYTIEVFDSEGNLNRTSVLDAVFVNGGNKARVIFESITLAGGTSLPSALTVEANKLFPADEEH